MNIVFAGTPDFAAASLSSLIEKGHNIVAVYTQPDRPAGRGKKLVKSAVKQVAEQHDIPCLQPEKLTSEEAQQTLAEWQPDLMIVAAYGLLLPKAVLEIPTLGCVNIHASLLPRWRGAAPIQRAIQAGDAKTGITIMQMDEGLDTGDMLLKLETEISPDDTGGSLHDRLAELGSRAILQYLEQRNGLEGQAQDDASSCYAKKLSKQEAWIDWRNSAEQICRNIRAFNPWPVAYTELQGQRIRILAASETATAPSTEAGQVINKSRDGIDIQCGSGALRVTRLQLAGAKAISAEEFFNGGKALFESGDKMTSPE